MRGREDKREREQIRIKEKAIKREEKCNKKERERITVS